MKNKTIAIEGISGIGKSNLGQHLSLNFNNSNRPNKWFFELDKDNPIIPKNHDHRIIDESVVLIKDYLKDASENNQINIFDGRFFLVNVDFALRHGLTKSQIIEKMHPMIDLINEYEVFLILLHTNNIDELFENTIKSRSCLKWYIDNIKQSKIKTNQTHINDSTVKMLMRIQQEIYLELFNYIHVEKKLLDITDLNWNKQYTKINDYFSFTTQNNLDIVKSDYTGIYIDSNGQKYDLVLENDQLLCKVHPYQIFKPAEQIFKLINIDQDTFMAKGQPIRLKFTRDNNGGIDGLYELGYDTKENYQGVIKDKFFKYKKYYEDK